MSVDYNHSPQRIGSQSRRSCSGSRAIASRVGLTSVEGSLFSSYVNATVITQIRLVHEAVEHGMICSAVGSCGWYRWVTCWFSWVVLQHWTGHSCTSFRILVTANMSVGVLCFICTWYNTAFDNLAEQGRIYGNCLWLHTHTQLFNGLFSWTTWVGRYQKDKPLWILLKQEMMGLQWRQLDHMQIICISIQTDNHASTPSSFTPDAFPATQPTASKHWRHCDYMQLYVILLLLSICAPWNYFATSEHFAKELTALFLCANKMCWKC